jgi:Tetratricopeptide repeat
MKKYGNSIDVFESALKLRVIECGDADSRESRKEAQLKMAKIRHNIGCVNFELGNLDEAKKSYVQAIDEQKAVFGSWTSPFSLLTDTSKPGYLTMASTMCNKGKCVLIYVSCSSALTRQGFTHERPLSSIHFFLSGNRIHRLGTIKLQGSNRGLFRVAEDPEGSFRSEQQAHHQYNGEYRVLSL